MRRGKSKWEEPHLGLSMSLLLFYSISHENLASKISFDVHFLKLPDAFIGSCYNNIILIPEFKLMRIYSRYFFSIPDYSEYGTARFSPYIAFGQRSSLQIANDEVNLLGVR